MQSGMGRSSCPVSRQYSWRITMMVVITTINFMMIMINATTD